MPLNHGGIFKIPRHQHGDQFGPNGRVVWEDDTAENIMRAFGEFVELRRKPSAKQSASAT